MEQIILEQITNQRWEGLRIDALRLLSIQQHSEVSENLSGVGFYCSSYSLFNVLKKADQTQRGDCSKNEQQRIKSSLWNFSYDPATTVKSEEHHRAEH